MVCGPALRTDVLMGGARSSSVLKALFRRQALYEHQHDEQVKPLGQHGQPVTGLTSVHLDTATEPERGLQSAAPPDLQDGLEARQERIESRGLLRTEVRSPVAVGRCTAVAA